MDLHIYNTLTRKKELFVPLMEDPNYKGPKKDFVGLYSCGPTVYWTPSIGNFRATFTADLIRNTLKLLGYNVKSVMNITDVGHLVSDADEGEDKLEKGSKREGISARDVAKKYEQIFKDGMKELNIDAFDVMPRATENISEQIELIKMLEFKKYTYVIDGDGIYMDTSKLENYGELMGPNYKKRLADLNAGERVKIRGKKHPTDFALWKFSPTYEKRQMERDSPWGKGFPGRHIECSAMSSKYLGEQFDIHHGGADHITIHHPNEIAQSECAFGVHPRVKYWVHNEFLQVNGGKMSKSLGNVYILDDIKAKGFFPLDLRYFYFMAQYGSFQNFTREGLQQSKTRYLSFIKRVSSIFGQRKNLLSVYQDIKNINNYFDFKKMIQLNNNSIKKFDAIIQDTILNNINTPALLAEIDLLIRSYVLDSINENQENVYIDDVLKFIVFIDCRILKLGIYDDLMNIEKHLDGIKYYNDDVEKIEIPDDVKKLAEQRLEAKQAKDYTCADEIRKEILDKGREIKDTKEGYELIKM